MEDTQIIELYWQRAEAAITETARKYGGYCHTISYNILGSREESEECVNDTYARTWTLLPPHRPRRLGAFLGKITRNLALDRYRYFAAQKRGGGQLALALDELAPCIPDAARVEDTVEKQELTDALNRFLSNLKPEQRIIFLRRYWYVESIGKIAADFGMTESKIKMMLLRARKELKDCLEREGIAL